MRRAVYWGIGTLSPQHHSVYQPPGKLQQKLPRGASGRPESRRRQAVGWADCDGRTAATVWLARRALERERPVRFHERRHNDRTSVGEFHRPPRRPCAAAPLAFGSEGADRVTCGGSVPETIRAAGMFCYLLRRERLRRNSLSNSENGKVFV
jgi:hypothetical protein